MPADVGDGGLGGDRSVGDRGVARSRDGLLQRAAGRGRIGGGGGGGVREARAEREESDERRVYRAGGSHGEHVGDKVGEGIGGDVEVGCARAVRVARADTAKRHTPR